MKKTGFGRSVLSAVLGMMFTFSALAPALAQDGEEPQEALYTAAEAAVALRAALAVQQTTDLALEQYDYTHNGLVNEVDAKAALWSAAGKIPDFVKFVERLPGGLLPEADFEKFSYSGVVEDGAGNYQSDTVSIAVTRGELFDSVYYAAEIYVQDLSCIRTAASKKKASSVLSMAKDHDALIAINGDYYTQRYLGPIIRNGETVVDGIDKKWDVGILTKQGELKVFPHGALDEETLTALAPVQSWVFGPNLLDEEGKAATEFRSNVTSKNPRSVFGMYGIGHYCFLLVDGRQHGYSDGMTMQELASLCEELGLKTAYNLDGGRSAVMATRQAVVSQPYLDGRGVSDILYIREPGE